MNILKINSSASGASSLSRNVVAHIISKLTAQNPSAVVKERDVANNNLPYLDEAFVKAMFQKGNLSEEEKKVLKVSDELIQELETNDVIVIGAPIYNFTIPASLKSYFDLVARPGKTFNMGPIGKFTGLLTGKKAIVVITSATTKIGSSQEFSKDYIAAFLKFIGITDVEFVEMDQTVFSYQEKLQSATAQIEAMVG